MENNEENITITIILIGEGGGRYVAMIDDQSRRAVVFK